MKITTLCGSMRFFDQMLKVASELTLRGEIVIAPFAVVAPEDQGSEVKKALDELHRKKIRMADRIVVVTNLDGYIGDSTRAEIEYAQTIGVEVSYKLVSA